jgi:hypothetical protein
MSNTNDAADTARIEHYTASHGSTTFMSDKLQIVQTGCSACQKHFGTAEQFKRHVTEDVLPRLLDRLSSEGKN